MWLAFSDSRKSDIFTSLGGVAGLFLSALLSGSAFSATISFSLNSRFLLFSRTNWTFLFGLSIFYRLSSRFSKVKKVKIESMRNQNLDKNVLASVSNSSYVSYLTLWFLTVFLIISVCSEGAPFSVNASKASHLVKGCLELFLLRFFLRLSTPKTFTYIADTIEEMWGFRLFHLLMMAPIVIRMKVWRYLIIESIVTNY